MAITTDLMETEEYWNRYWGASPI